MASTDTALQYLRFVQQNYDDLSLLVQEGVLESHFPKVYSFGGTFRADANIVRAYERWPPSYLHFTHGDVTLPDQQRVADFQGYLCFVASTAQQAGFGLSTWSLDFLQALWTSVSQLAEGGLISTAPIGQPLDKLGQRRLTEDQLTHTVLERYLPRVDDLPFDRLLELRRKCSSELEGFRVGIRKLATQVDLTQSPSDWNLQLHDLVSQEVDPAIHDLGASLASARWNVLKNLATKEVVVGTAVGVGMALTVFPGATIDVKGAITAALAAGGAIVKGEIERSQVLRERTGRCFSV